MSEGSIIGFDINGKVCQISVYNRQTSEPDTMEAGGESCQIPLAMNYYKGEWTYGKNAVRMGSVRGSVTIPSIYEAALKKEKITIDEEDFDAVWLFAEFMKQILQNFKKIDSITFTVSEINEDVRFLLKGIGQRLGVAKEMVYVQDYKESFCHYMLNQPKELWQYEAALFYCDGELIRAYMLRELKTDRKKEQEHFVTVDLVAEAKMEELASVYPILDVDGAKMADEQFRRFIQSVFDKKLVSSVFLTGEGFENNWYPNSLRVLCNGRRAFMGNNLYSKGACYTAWRKIEEQADAPVYLDETKMTERISMKMRVKGEEGWYPLVSWGEHWYESDKEYEVLMGDTEDIEICVESLLSDKVRIAKVNFDGMPKRKNYSLRLRISVMFADERTCQIVFEDMGFGEFYESTGFKVEKVIELGGSNGQFNSLSSKKSKTSL